MNAGPGRQLAASKKAAPSPDPEITRLSRCINDLVGVLSLPAVWAGGEPSRIATELLKVVVRIMALDFAYLRVTSSPDEAQHEWLHAPDGGAPGISPRHVGELLSGRIPPTTPSGRFRMPNPIGDGVSSVAYFRLGLTESLGTFVAGSMRKSFPTRTEGLVMQVATNQAAIALQEARRVQQRQRDREELARRVAEGTKELTAVNEALKTEIAERGRAEERVRQDEAELRFLINLVPQLIVVLELDGTVRCVNRSGIAYLGGAAAPDPAGHLHAKLYHPEDVNEATAAVERAFEAGCPCCVEARIRRHDGHYRWFEIRYEPVWDQGGRILRWYGTAIDVDDRRQKEERMREENLALREEIDKASKFEEIVGISVPLRAVLRDVSKVAPTDSTVLISGETGTGKELVARAIHKRSRRASRPFVSVNCAAIPPALIASELFGHEKGAFTGALERRVGRFELAEGGTLFLDEVGDLPHETQLALLRVLQEHEFERLGGARPIRTDVRLVAATNRSLASAIEAGEFRSDLFYRLNVFPVAMPPLRERREDIPLLVRYFVDRYSRDAGRKVKQIAGASMDLMTSYSWPGNIRELQNVIERSLILCDADTLIVDPRWFPHVPAAVEPSSKTLLAKRREQERAIIESALADTRGLVSGSFGAAAKLGIPSSTLESKIKALGIDKRRFKIST